MTTFTPASIIVANWREKICSDFGSIFFEKLLPAASFLARESIRCGSSPRWRSRSRAASRSGAWSSPLSSTPWALMAE